MIPPRPSAPSPPPKWAAVNQISIAFRYLRGLAQKNPHMALAATLFVAGAILIRNASLATIGGALFGAGASLIGAWVTELNKRRTDAEEKAEREIDARGYLAPELRRTIVRALYIHERASANYVSVSAEQTVSTGDLQRDFVPYMPVLYPTSPQFRDLSGEDAVALVAFYDSLHDLHNLVTDWWQREGQLPANVFNVIVHSAHKSLVAAQECMTRFEIDTRFPPEYSSHPTLSTRISRSLSFEQGAREHQMARQAAKHPENT